MLKQDMSPKGIIERVCELIESDLRALVDCDCPNTKADIVENLKRYKKAQAFVNSTMWCTRHYQVMSHQINKLDFLLNG